MHCMGCLAKLHSIVNLAEGYHSPSMVYRKISPGLLRHLKTNFSLNYTALAIHWQCCMAYIWNLRLPLHLLIEIHFYLSHML